MLKQARRLRMAVARDLIWSRMLSAMQHKKTAYNRGRELRRRLSNLEDASLQLGFVLSNIDFMTAELKRRRKEARKAAADRARLRAKTRVLEKNPFGISSSNGVKVNSLPLSRGPASTALGMSSPRSYSPRFNEHAADRRQSELVQFQKQTRQDDAYSAYNFNLAPPNTSSSTTAVIRRAIAAVLEKNCMRNARSSKGSGSGSLMELTLATLEPFSEETEDDDIGYRFDQDLDDSQGEGGQMKDDRRTGAGRTDRTLGPRHTEDRSSSTSASENEEGDIIGSNIRMKKTHVFNGRTFVNPALLNNMLAPEGETVPRTIVSKMNFAPAISSSTTRSSRRNVRLSTNTASSGVSSTSTTISIPRNSTFAAAEAMAEEEENAKYSLLLANTHRGVTIERLKQYAENRLYPALFRGSAPLLSIRDVAESEIQENLENFQSALLAVCAFLPHAALGYDRAAEAAEEIARDLHGMPLTLVRSETVMRNALKRIANNATSQAPGTPFTTQTSSSSKKKTKSHKSNINPREQRDEVADTSTRRVSFFPAAKTEGSRSATAENKNTSILEDAADGATAAATTTASTLEDSRTASKSNYNMLKRLSETNDQGSLPGVSSREMTTTTVEASTSSPAEHMHNIEGGDLVSTLDRLKRDLDLTLSKLQEAVAHEVVAPHEGEGAHERAVGESMTSNIGQHPHTSIIGPRHTVTGSHTQGHEDASLIIGTATYGARYNHATTVAEGLNEHTQSLTVLGGGGQHTEPTHNSPLGGQHTETFAHSSATTAGHQDSTSETNMTQHVEDVTHQQAASTEPHNIIEEHHRDPTSTSRTSTPTPVGEPALSSMSSNSTTYQMTTEHTAQQEVEQSAVSSIIDPTSPEEAARETVHVPNHNSPKIGGIHSMKTNHEDPAELESGGGAIVRVEQDPLVQPVVVRDDITTTSGSMAAGEALPLDNITTCSSLAVGVASGDVVQRTTTTAQEVESDSSSQPEDRQRPTSDGPKLRGGGRTSSRSNSTLLITSNVNIRRRPSDVDPYSSHSPRGVRTSNMNSTSMSLLPGAQQGLLGGSLGGEVAPSSGGAAPTSSVGAFSQSMRPEYEVTLSQASKRRTGMSKPETFWHNVHSHESTLAAPVDENDEKNEESEASLVNTLFRKRPFVERIALSRRSGSSGGVAEEQSPPLSARLQYRHDPFSYVRENQTDHLHFAPDVRTGADDDVRGANQGNPNGPPAIRTLTFTPAEQQYITNTANKVVKKLGDAYGPDLGMTELLLGSATRAVSSKKSGRETPKTGVGSPGFTPRTLVTPRTPLVTSPRGKMCCTPRSHERPHDNLPLQALQLPLDQILNATSAEIAKQSSRYSKTVLRAHAANTKTKQMASNTGMKTKQMTSSGSAARTTTTGGNKKIISPASSPVASSDTTWSTLRKKNSIVQQHLDLLHEDLRGTRALSQRAGGAHAFIRLPQDFGDPRQKLVVANKGDVDDEVEELQLLGGREEVCGAISSGAADRRSSDIRSSMVSAASRRSDVAAKNNREASARTLKALRSGRVHLRPLVAEIARITQEPASRSGSSSSRNFKAVMLEMQVEELVLAWTRDYNEKQRTLLEENIEGRRTTTTMGDYPASARRTASSSCDKNTSTTASTDESAPSLTGELDAGVILFYCRQLFTSLQREDTRELRRAREDEARLERASRMHDRRLRWNRAKALERKLIAESAELDAQEEAKKYLETHTGVRATTGASSTSHTGVRATGTSSVARYVPRTARQSTARKCHSPSVRARGPNTTAGPRASAATPDFYTTKMRERERERERQARQAGSSSSTEEAEGDTSERDPYAGRVDQRDLLYRGSMARFEGSGIHLQLEGEDEDHDHTDETEDTEEEEELQDEVASEVEEQGEEASEVDEEDEALHDQEVSTTVNKRITTPFDSDEHDDPRPPPIAEHFQEDAFQEDDFSVQDDGRDVHLATVLEGTEVETSDPEAKQPSPLQETQRPQEGQEKGPAAQEEEEEEAIETTVLEDGKPLLQREGLQREGMESTKPQDIPEAVGDSPAAKSEEGNASASLSEVEAVAPPSTLPLVGDEQQEDADEDATNRLSDNQDLGNAKKMTSSDDEIVSADEHDDEIVSADEHEDHASLMSAHEGENSDDFHSDPLNSTFGSVQAD
ncbi:unnamed protein product [Amoebophrya sp. A25]|nr:unnamed protein product [Amoebophrya sp. A25]|eukprot:GSA25T00026536001.1